jgi:poly-gamma-glutamate synthesis protein (capsule biosynthesis protein)
MTQVLRSAAVIVILLAFGCAGQSGPRQVAADQDISLVFVGDVMLSRGVARHVTKTQGKDFTFTFREVAPILRDADLAFGNLESPISGRGEKLAKKYVFNAPPEAIEGIAYAGFDVLSLANNHILDYGELALTDTLRYLDQAAIHAVGLTQPGRLRQTPVVIERGGLRLAYLGYADPAGKYSYPPAFKQFPVRPAELGKARVEEEIAAIDQFVDLVLVSVHWGTEYRSLPDERQVEMARFMIDAGADIVIGHHPHVVQPVERYRQGIIFYSLGNFVFDQYTRPGTREGVIARVVIEKGRLKGVATLPVFIGEGWQPRPKQHEFQRVAPGTLAPHSAGVP